MEAPLHLHQHVNAILAIVTAHLKEVGGRGRHGADTAVGRTPAVGIDGWSGRVGSTAHGRVWPRRPRLPCAAVLHNSHGWVRVGGAVSRPRHPRGGRREMGLVPAGTGRKPAWERPRPSPPPRKNWPGPSIPCWATGKSTQMLVRDTPNASTSSGRCARSQVLRPNWAANRRRCPMSVIRDWSMDQMDQRRRDSIG